MGDGELRAELAALLDEWNAADDRLAERRFFGRVSGAENHRRNGRRRALGRRAIGLLGFDAAALALGLSHDELCRDAFGSRVEPDEMRGICARLDRGDEQLVAAAVAAELDVGPALVRKLVERFGSRRTRQTHTRPETRDLPERGAA